MSTKLPKI